MSGFLDVLHVTLFFSFTDSVHRCRLAVICLAQAGRPGYRQFLEGRAAAVALVRLQVALTPCEGEGELSQ